MDEANETVVYLQKRRAMATHQFNAVRQVYAVKIQRVARGFLARAVVLGLRRDRAAVFIQRLVRGRSTRRQFLARKLQATVANTVLGLRALNKVQQLGLPMDSNVLDCIKASIGIQKRWRLAFRRVLHNVGHVRDDARWRAALRATFRRVAWTVAKMMSILRFWRKAVSFHLLTAMNPRRRKSSISKLTAGVHALGTTRRYSSLSVLEEFTKLDHGDHVIENVSFFSQAPKAWYTRHVVADAEPSPAKDDARGAKVVKLGSLKHSRQVRSSSLPQSSEWSRRAMEEKRQKPNAGLDDAFTAVVIAAPTPWKSNSTTAAVATTTTTESLPYAVESKRKSLENERAADAAYFEASERQKKERQRILEAKLDARRQARARRAEALRRVKWMPAKKAQRGDPTANLHSVVAGAVAAASPSTKTSPAPRPLIDAAKASVPSIKTTQSPSPVRVIPAVEATAEPLIATQAAPSLEIFPDAVAARAPLIETDSSPASMLGASSNPAAGSSWALSEEAIVATVIATAIAKSATPTRL
ncbi:hypothetical protein AC1031_010719 [Aphanomyces cochlioides]|nr:hypothetical protein AC1031_010719 [Aphanomyces cochlioides]